MLIHAGKTGEAEDLQNKTEAKKKAS